MIDFGKFYDRSILLLGNPFGTNCFIFICYRSNEQINILILKALFLKEYDWPRGQYFLNIFPKCFPNACTVTP